MTAAGWEAFIETACKYQIRSFLASQLDVFKSLCGIFVVCVMFSSDWAAEDQPLIKSQLANSLSGSTTSLNAASFRDAKVSQSSLFTATLDLQPPNAAERRMFPRFASQLLACRAAVGRHTVLLKLPPAIVSLK